jgi:hypothetical protein
MRDTAFEDGHGSTGIDTNEEWERGEEEDL